MNDFSPKTFLMWANQDPKYPNSFVLKMDNQRILGLVRTDKKGQTYWKFKERSQLRPESSPVMETKPEQAKEYEEPINHPNSGSTN